MDRIRMLKEQATLLRDLAARSETGYPEIARRMRDLADQCEELAGSLSASLSMPRGDDPNKKS